MEYIGFLAAIIIGISLGLLGAGGSILTIPVLVYLIHIPPIDATSYSLFIVGITSFIGTIGYLNDKLVCLKTVAVFGSSSIISIFFTRKYILHAIPESIFNLGTIAVTKNIALMILLAVLMLFASYSMIKKAAPLASSDDEPYRTFPILKQGLFVGIVVGLVGAGGGFLIIPALVHMARLTMKKAIGTALAIITINSFVGFFSDFSQHQFDWHFLIVFSAFAIGGILIGKYISKFISSEKLKPFFGWFVLVVGSFIILKEFLFN